MINDEKRYPLSVILPVHRSDLDVGRAIRSLLENTSLDLQIIVAANNDRRSELRRINANVPDYPCISLINIQKAGKANAINRALHYVKNKYVLIGDADTLFIKSGLSLCVKKMYADETILAISGIVDPIATNTISCVQKFEYRRIFGIFRPFWNLFNANMMVSGCAGIFKTEALFRVGLYDCRTLGEDFEITLRLHDYYIRHDIPYKIEYVDVLFAKTDVPLTAGGLIKQRGRWFKGQVDVVWKYRRILFHPERYKNIFIPYLLAILFELFKTYLKWVSLYITCIWISIVSETPFFGMVLISGILFVVFECIFNICAIKHLKIKKKITIIGLTIVLTGIQFVLKDTNIILAIKLRMRKENKWE